MAEPSATPSPAAATDAAFGALKSYDRGSPRAALLPLDAAVAASLNDASARSALEKRLIAALEEGGSFVRREYICSKLTILGSAASVKALSALLLVPELVTAARNALQAIPGDEPIKALRDALPRVAGASKVGVIQSLGLRRDEQSVPALRKLLGDAAPQVASAAAAALGEIGTVDAAKALQEFQPRAPELLRAAAADACLVCAEKLVAAGRKPEAATLYKLLSTESQPKHVQYAAKQGLSRSA